MLFNSLNYLMFFPAVVLIYYLIPFQKVRNVMLLAASLFFYMCWNPKYIVLMAGCIVITYFDAIFIDLAKKEEEKGIEAGRRRTGKPTIYVAVTIISMFAVLAYFKYANFLAESLVDVMKLIGIHLVIPKFDVVLPVGISFFTFQALSYDIDVYRGTTKVEKNFLRYALFVSFFPQLVAGPIERSGHLLSQFAEKHRFDADRITKGIMMMLYGFFMKVVIADRVAILVDQVYNYYGAYSGLVILLATMLFAVQIYCDFGGYTNIAIGSAQVLGFDLIQNFRQPYLAVSCADFWRRWHISLTGWFRDYLYFPLGGSRTTTFKRFRNIMIVFLVSGLWHGAEWTFVIWGGLNGLFQIIGMLLMPLREKCARFLKLNTASLGHRIVRSIVTFFLIDFTWIFFRASSLRNAVGIIRRLFQAWNPWILFDGSLYELGLSRIDFWVTMAAIAVLFLVDLLHENQVKIRESVLRQPVVLRWVVYYTAVIAILLFGVYGPGYDAAGFIYFQF